MTAAGVGRFFTRDFGEFCATMNLDGVTVSPLSPERFEFEAVHIRMGEVSVLSGTNSPVLLRAPVPDGISCVFLPMAPENSLILNGRVSSLCTFVVYGPGATHMSANHTKTAWASVTLTPAQLYRVLPASRARLSQPGENMTLLGDAGAARRARSLFRNAEKVARSDPIIFEGDETRRSLRSSVLETMHELLAGPHEGRPSRALRPSPGRERIVRNVDDYIRAHMDRVITPADVSSDLGISESRVRSAFARTFGIGLAKYLFLRRLVALHHALRSGEHDATGRRVLAVAHGFWNLERLKCEYQRWFGHPFDPDAAASALDGSVRDAAGQAVADRLWRDTPAGRR